MILSLAISARQELVKIPQLWKLRAKVNGLSTKSKIVVVAYA
jgi:hypothetical protein